jgi:hypothetical protein
LRSKALSRERVVQACPFDPPSLGRVDPFLGSEILVVGMSDAKSSLQVDPIRGIGSPSAPFGSNAATSGWRKSFKKTVDIALAL